jgi:hypothetical protein
MEVRFSHTMAENDVWTLQISFCEYQAIFGAVRPEKSTSSLTQPPLASRLLVYNFMEVRSALCTAEPVDTQNLSW